MVSLYQIKPAFQKLLRPLVNYLAKAGVSPNSVTILAIILSAIIGIAFTLKPDGGVILFVPFVLFLRMALNAIDGMLAREHKMKTPFGAILNELGDVISDALIFLPFAFVVGVEPVVIVILVIVSIISELAGILGQCIGASRRYDGPMGKSDRAFLFGVLSIIIYFEWVGNWMNWVLSIAVVLIILNIIIRIRSALREIHNNLEQEEGRKHV